MTKVPNQQSPVLTFSKPTHWVNRVSQKTIDIVKATAPILKKQGQQMTTRMYEIMFHNYPEVKQQFDMSAQADGSQPAKLATAVYSYATHLDNPEALKSMIKRIAHRHVQTHVQPKQYPIVGESLLQAMKEVLGATATEDVMSAWAEAYQALACLFIETECLLYEEEKLGFQPLTKVDPD